MVTAGGRNDAERLGEGLVVEHLAARCSVVPMVHSFYYSDGLLQRDTEPLLMIKTVRSRSSAVYEYLRKHHGSKGPVIYEVAIDRGSATYLKWVSGQGLEPASDRQVDASTGLGVH